MKNRTFNFISSTTFLFVLISCISLFTSAQVPQSMNYQGIARDASGNPLSKQQLSLQLAILPTQDAQVPEYEETQQVMTNEFGLYTLQIGHGTVISGDMKTIKWETGNKYIHVSIDPKGGANYQEAGTTQLLSVPYAMYAEKSGISGSTIHSSGGQTRATNNYIEKTSSTGVVNSTSLLYDNGTSVSIGTTTPNAGVKLQVNSSAANAELIRMQNINANGFGRFTMYNDGATSYATFTKYGSTYPSGYAGIVSQYPYAGLLAFGNNGGNFLVTNGGSIGLSLFKGGTSKLKFNADYTTENLGLGGNAVPIDRLHINNTDGTSMPIRITNNTTGHTSADGMVIGNSGNAASIINKENSTLLLGTNNATRMTIDAAGNVGIGATPVASALLELKDTSKGFLLPRMTTAQRNSIVSPAVGLQIMNVDDQCIDMYDGANWIKTCGLKVTGSITDLSHMLANSWAGLGSIPTGPRSNAISFSIGNKGYVGMGAYNGMIFNNDLFEFDQVNGSWTAKASLPSLGRQNAVAFSINNKGYVICGYNGMMMTYYNEVWEYDPATNAWTQKNNFPGNARQAAQGFVIGNKGYVGLGYNGSTDYNDFWEYDPALDSWTQKANYLGGGRRFTFGIGTTTKGYIGLGTNVNGNYYNDVWEFNPSTNAWTQKQNFPGSGIHSMASISAGSIGYMGIGYNGTNNITDFYEYNPSIDTWTSKASFIGTARKNAIGFAIGQRIYIGTGDDGMPQSDMYEYLDNNVIGQTYNSNTIASNNAVSDGAWTLYNDRVYNSNSGNVGIGTSYPSNKLSVLGNADFDGNVGIGITAPAHKLSVVGNTFLNGNLGIGYVAPSNKLSVNGSTDISGNLGVGTIAPTNKLSVVGNADVSGNMGIGNATPTNKLSVVGNADISGNTGIGTISPSNKLSVVGNADVSGNLGVGITTANNKFSVIGNTDISGYVGIGLTSPHAPLQFPSNSANRKVVLYEDANNDHQFYGFGIGGAALRYQVGHAGASHVFYAGSGTGSSTELMRIAGNGNVGIGVNNPTASIQVARGTGANGTAAFAGSTYTSFFNYSSAENTYIRGGKNNSKVIINDQSGTVDIGGPMGGVQAQCNINNIQTGNDLIGLHVTQNTVTSSTGDSRGIQVEASGGTNGDNIGIESIVGTSSTIYNFNAAGYFIAGGNGPGVDVALWATNNGGNALVTVGNVNINGSIAKSSGSFKIDHPQDPANKYLYHSFVESPDMMNIYNGNITTGNDSIAVVELPKYFTTLNKDFRYQLTVMGQFAQAIVFEKVTNNQFKIKTNQANVEVSWQVTGIRQDNWANAHRIIPEVEKESKDKGKYLNPEVFNQPLENGIYYRPTPKMSEQK